MLDKLTEEDYCATGITTNQIGWVQKMASQVCPSNLDAAIQTRSLPSLDGLRTLAVSLVVFYHSGLPVNGGLGVLMFFVISGFLITWLLLHEDRKWGNICLRSFYIRRTLRIFPAFYVFWFLVVFGFLMFRKELQASQAMASFFYVNNYYQAVWGDPGSALSHTWSLGIEEQFYLLWPFAFLLLRSIQRRIYALLIVIPVLWIYRTVAVLLFGVPQGYVYEALDMRADQLLMGCLLAMILFQRSIPGVLRVLVKRPWVFWVTLGALAFSSMVPQITHHAWRYRDLVGFTLDPILTSILILQSLAFSRSSAAWLNWKWMRLVGRMSYSIYLYQQITLQPVRQVLRFLPMPVRVIAGIATCLIFAAASFYFVEQPFQRLKERIGRRTSHATPIDLVAPRAA